MGYALALWGPDDARPVLERSIALGRRLADDWVIADGLKMLSIDHMARDDLDGIAETAAELQRVAETLDNSFFLAWADAVLGIRDLRRGDLGAARDKLEASIARCRQVGEPSTEGLATAVLSEVEARTGDIDDARARAGRVHRGRERDRRSPRRELRGAGGDRDHARRNRAGRRPRLGASMAADLSFRAQKAWAGILHGAACRALGDLDAAGSRSTRRSRSQKRPATRGRRASLGTSSGS